MDNENTLDLVDNAPSVEEQTPAQAPEPQAAEGNPEPAEAGETGSEAEASAPESEGKSELPRGIQKRFAKMTKQRHEQQAEIEALRQQNQEQQQQLESLKPRSRDEFASEDEWLDHRLDQKSQEMQLKQSQQQTEAQISEQQARATATAWHDKVEAFKEVIPDFNEVVGNAQIPMSQDTLGIIANSDVGPQLAYHLAQNPEEASYVDSLDERSRDRYIGRLESRVEAQSYSAPAAPITNAAPTPKSQGKPGGTVSPDNMSIDDWMKTRRKQIGR